MQGRELDGPEVESDCQVRKARSRLCPKAFGRNRGGRLLLPSATAVSRDDCQARNLGDAFPRKCQGVDNRAIDGLRAGLLERQRVCEIARPSQDQACAADVLSARDAAYQAVQGVCVVFVRFAPVRALWLEFEVLAIDLMPNAVGVIAQLIRERGHNAEVSPEGRAEIRAVENPHCLPRVMDPSCIIGHALRARTTTAPPEA